MPKATKTTKNAKPAIPHFETYLARAFGESREENTTHLLMMLAQDPNLHMLNLDSLESIAILRAQHDAAGLFEPYGGIELATPVRLGSR